MLKNDFENQNFEFFEEVVDNFGRSEDDVTSVVKRCIFPLDAYVCGFMCSLHKKF